MVVEHGNEANIDNVVGVPDGGGRIGGRNIKMEEDLGAGVAGRWVSCSAGMVEPGGWVIEREHTAVKAGQ